MALDRLVDSAQLDSDLEDIADAIRAKSGGSSPLAFPAGFISEIESIETGGGIESVEGTFTLENDSAFPTLTHNFGTTKIAGFVIPHYQIVGHSGYKAYMSFFVNWAAFIPDGETWIKDFTPYNSTRFPNAITVDATTIRGLKRDAGYSSPWTTQSDQWAGTYYNGLEVTETTVRVGTGANWCSGTYYYKLFKLG